MRYDNFSTEELYELRSKMVSKNQETSELNFLIDCRESEYYFSLLENTSATGGPAGSAGAVVGGGGVSFGNAATGGMGAVTAAQPSNFSGVTSDPSFTAGGGKSGSGDIGVGYNTGGKKVFQKIPIDNRKGTNKRRKNKMLSGLKQTLMSRQDFTAGQGDPKPKKVMDFESFSKEDLNKVTKINR